MGSDTIKNTNVSQNSHSIDLRKKSITPYIIYHLRKTLNTIENGEILQVITDHYKATDNDMDAYCRMTGNILEGTDTRGTEQIYHIRKNTGESTRQVLAMIISNPDLEKLISPLGLALSAALSGREVHLYFQGPAVKLLKKKYKATLGGIYMPFSIFARKAMAASGHLPPDEKIQQLKELGSFFYICGGSMKPFGVSESDFIFDDIVIAQYFTFLEVMNRADMRIFLQ